MKVSPPKRPRVPALNVGAMAEVVPPMPGPRDQQRSAQESITQ